MKKKLMTVLILVVTLSMVGCGANDTNETVVSDKTEYSETITESVSAFGTVEDILRVSSLKAACETDVDECYVHVESTENPYDVVYDYGDEYDAYIDACDWSLVFDAGYYKENFPMLALLYNYDDELLLKHFQTVGVHEGRQGSANFNVGAYCANGDMYDDFERNFAAYYIYYMLNYETEKHVNTVSNNSGEMVYRQYTNVLTACQNAEWKAVNNYREQVGSDDLLYESELAALANYRAYVNVVEGYYAHDWLDAGDNRSIIGGYADTIAEWDDFSENNLTNPQGKVYAGTTFASRYRDSESHYAAMINANYEYLGVSNVYYDGEHGSQFDLFLNGDIHTPMHEAEDKPQPNVEKPEPNTSADESESVDDNTSENETVSTFGTVEDILRVSVLKAACETDVNECYVYVTSTENPYDVVYDYGDEYDAYVDACDWSLVFDVEYYKENFPMLALLYNYDDELLLKHFQTVGVHEGRQGSADFNVGAYVANGDIYDDFERNFAAYYLYYMLNYETEKHVNTVSNNTGYTVYRQYTYVPTACQKAEWSAVNDYREEVGSPDIVFESELTALANYRAYVNVVEGYYAHDWLYAGNNETLFRGYADTIAEWDDFSENNLTNKHGRVYAGSTFASRYKNSESHYAAMINADYDYLGVSNVYYDGHHGSQFDLFMGGDIHTPMFP